MLSFHRFAIFFVLAAALFSQSELGTRSVHGIVTDKNGEPLRGAVVQLEDARSLQIRSFITKRDGAFTFHRLSTEVDYTLQARYRDKASDTKRLSKFDSHKDPEVDLKIAL